MNKMLKDLFYTNTLQDREWFGRRYVFSDEHVYEINRDDIYKRNIIVMKNDDIINSILSLKISFRDLGYNYTKSIDIYSINTFQELLEALEKEYIVMKHAIMKDRVITLKEGFNYITPRDGVLYKSTKYNCAYSEETNNICTGGADGYWIRL